MQTLGYEFRNGIDGRFGPETERNVKSFQQRHGLTIDGWAGDNTLAKIETELEQLKVDKSPELPVFDKKAGWLDLILAIIGGIFK